LVDLDRRKTGDGDIQAFHGQDVSEGGQLDCQALAIPGGIFPDLVVGKREGAPLGFGQSPYRDCGDLLEIEQLCRCCDVRLPAFCENLPAFPANAGRETGSMGAASVFRVSQFSFQYAAASY
jgi:hypothetical protein